MIQKQIKVTTTQVTDFCDRTFWAKEKPKYILHLLVGSCNSDNHSFRDDGQGLLTKHR